MSQASSRARVLLVEDTVLVAEMIKDILTMLGHEVDTATDGVRALERVETSGYDVIISDLCMPELDGLGLYRALQRRHPALQSRLIFITGSQLNPEMDRALAETGAPLLSKPFEVMDLQHTIEHVLSGATAGGRSYRAS